MNTIARIGVAGALLVPAGIGAEAMFNNSSAEAWAGNGSIELACDGDKVVVNATLNNGETFAPVETPAGTIDRNAMRGRVVVNGVQVGLVSNGASTIIESQDSGSFSGVVVDAQGNQMSELDAANAKLLSPWAFPEEREPADYSEHLWATDNEYEGIDCDGDDEEPTTTTSSSSSTSSSTSSTTSTTTTTTTLPSTTTTSSTTPSTTTTTTTMPSTTTTSSTTPTTIPATTTTTTPENRQESSKICDVRIVDGKLVAYIITKTWEVEADGDIVNSSIKKQEVDPKVCARTE